MTRTFVRAGTIVGSLALLLALSCTASAQEAFAYSKIQFSNLIISPSTGFVTTSGPWVATAIAQAQDSLGGDVRADDLSVGGQADASAKVTLADGHALLDADKLTGLAESTVNIPDCGFFARSVGRGSLFNTFTIDGGVGAVDVDFMVDVAATFNVFTGPCGELASTDTTFEMDVFGFDARGIPIQNPLFFRFEFRAVFGPNQQNPFAYTDHFERSLPLAYGNSYDTFLFLDSESEGITVVPEPAVWTWTAAGLVMLATVVARKRRLVSEGLVSIRDTAGPP